MGGMRSTISIPGVGGEGAPSPVYLVFVWRARQ
jgi:hypothetical protein